VTGVAATTLGERAGPALAKGGTMRALTLVSDRKIEIIDVATPPAPGAGEVQIGIKAIGLNHIDVWGWRGMAFASAWRPPARSLPSVPT
jgi:alcohol dehydrogenase